MKSMTLKILVETQDLVEPGTHSQAMGNLLRIVNHKFSSNQKYVHETRWLIVNQWQRWENR